MGIFYDNRYVLSIDLNRWNNDRVHFHTTEPRYRPRLAIWNESQVFLAGTIEMGAVPDWQKAAADKIASMVDDDHHPVFMSPRRDTGFKPGMEEEQIVWEQDGLDSSDLIYVH